MRKITGQNETIFVYNGAGQMVAEYATQISSTPQVSYTTMDHLGSPRIITDGGGAVIARHDYTAFGSDVAETVGAVGGRTASQGYGAIEQVRQGYTGYENDEESELDYAQARYYNSAHGRFTSVDPLTASASIKDPQTFNRYSYALNSPYKFTDPLGLLALTSAGACGQWCNNSGGVVDGSAFSGKDSSFDWSQQRQEARQITITGGNAEQRAAVQASIDTLRAQSPSAEAGFSVFEGTAEGYSLSIEILDDATFDSIHPVKEDGKKANAVTSNNGGGNAADPNTGENSKIDIRASAIDVKKENSDRKANNETKLEGIMAHELGHAFDIASNQRAWYQRNKTDENLSYENRRNEKYADASLKWITLERSISSNRNIKINDGVYRFKKTELTEPRIFPKFPVIK